MLWNNETKIRRTSGKRIKPQVGEKVSFEFTKDMKLVTSIISHPKIYPYVTDDFSPKPNEFEMICDPSLKFVRVYEGERTLGIFTFIIRNRIWWEIHTCLLPCVWGNSVKILTGVFKWIWENTECQRITSEVSVNNRLAYRLGIISGMKEIGTNEKSILQGGVLRDQVMLGISKGEICQY